MRPPAVGARVVIRDVPAELDELEGRVGDVVCLQPDTGRYLVELLPDYKPVSLHPRHLVEQPGGSSSAGVAAAAAAPRPAIALPSVAQLLQFMLWPGALLAAGAAVVVMARRGIVADLLGVDIGFAIKCGVLALILARLGRTTTAAPPPRQRGERRREPRPGSFSLSTMLGRVAQLDIWQMLMLGNLLEQVLGGAGRNFAFMRRRRYY